MTELTVKAAPDKSLDIGRISSAENNVIIKSRKERRYGMRVVVLLAVGLAVMIVDGVEAWCVPQRVPSYSGPVLSPDLEPLHVDHRVAIGGVPESPLPKLGFSGPVDAPYRAARAAVNLRVASGEAKSAIIRELAGRVDVAAPNAPAVFAWAYALRQLTTTLGHSVSALVMEKDALNLMMKDGPQDSFEFERTLFLLRTDTHDDMDPDPAIIQLGWRLLAKASPDDEVEAGMALELSNIRNPSSQVAALRFARDLVRRHPSRPRPMKVLALVYMASYFLYYRPADGQEFLRLWREYQRMAGTRRDGSEWAIAEVQRDLDRRTYIDSTGTVRTRK